MFIYSMAAPHATDPKVANSSRHSHFEGGVPGELDRNPTPPPPTPPKKSIQIGPPLTPNPAPPYQRSKTSNIIIENYYSHTPG